MMRGDMNRPFSRHSLAAALLFFLLAPNLRAADDFDFDQLMKDLRAEPRSQPCQQPLFGEPKKTKADLFLPSGFSYGSAVSKYGSGLGSTADENPTIESTFFRGNVVTGKGLAQLAEFTRGVVFKYPSKHFRNLYTEKQLMVGAREAEADRAVYQQKPASLFLYESVLAFLAMMPDSMLAEVPMREAQDEAFLSRLADILYERLFVEDNKFPPLDVDYPFDARLYGILAEHFKFLRTMDARVSNYQAYVSPMKYVPNQIMALVYFFQTMDLASAFRERLMTEQEKVQLGKGPIPLPREEYLENLHFVIRQFDAGWVGGLGPDGESTLEQRTSLVTAATTTLFELLDHWEANQWVDKSWLRQFRRATDYLKQRQNKAFDALVQDAIEQVMPEEMQSLLRAENDLDRERESATPAVAPLLPMKIEPPKLEPPRVLKTPKKAPVAKAISGFRKILADLAQRDQAQKEEAAHASQRTDIRRIEIHRSASAKLAEFRQGNQPRQHAHAVYLAWKNLVESQGWAQARRDPNYPDEKVMEHDGTYPVRVRRLRLNNRGDRLIYHVDTELKLIQVLDIIESHDY
jgi:hypothetical protein